MFADVANVANEVCFTRAEYIAIGQAATDQAIQFGYFMIIIGFLIGYLGPRAMKYIKQRRDNGRPAE